MAVNSRDKMATNYDIEGDDSRPTPDSKATRSPKAKSSSLRHKTRFPTEAVRQSEESLRQLLDDFEHGRLNAFGINEKSKISIGICSCPITCRGYRHAPEDEGDSGIARKADRETL